MRSSLKTPIAAFAAVTAALLTGCASKTPDPVTLEDTKSVSATVQAIDLSSRIVTLKGPEGEVFSVKAAPEIQNLAQVEVGDRVTARYYEALVAELRHRGDGSWSTEEPDVSAAGARAAPGAKPGVGVGTQIRQSVRITSVDKKNHIVGFLGSDGIARNIPVTTPEGQAFASKLKPGDEVELTYTEALAVSVEPAN